MNYVPKHRRNDKRVHRHRYHKCPEYGCRKPTEVQCKYCKQYFCKEHIAPKLVGILNYIENVIKENDREKYAKYMEDYRRKDGHACGPYSAFWNKEFDSKPHENLHEKFITAMDRLMPSKAYEHEERDTENYVEERTPSRPGNFSYNDRRDNYNNQNYYRRYGRNFPRVHFPRLSIISKIFVIFLVLLAITYAINVPSYFWSIADVFAFFLVVIIAYRLFVWANRLPTHSDLHLFGIRILGGFIALSGFFVIFFIPGLIIDSLYPNQIYVYLQPGYVIPPVEAPIFVFFITLGISIVFLGVFMAFRFMRHSGIIVYQR